MSDEGDAKDPRGSDADMEEIESPALKALLKRALASEETSLEEQAAKGRALVAGVQRKLRLRSKGKFYADGWSTSQSRTSYGFVAGVMLVIIVVVYLALGPMGISLR